MKIVPSIKLTLTDIARATGAPLPQIDSTICAIATNSQECNEHDLFIALNGESTSGENFTENARQNGAFILSAKDKKADIKVANTEYALLRIAKYYKQKLKNLKCTVAVTGSVGKTTTKNMLSKILATEYQVHATYANYNNYLGLTHTILTAPQDTEILVIEMGMNHFGEISNLSMSAAPDVAVITNVGTAHLGNLGSREAIAKAKLEITDGMTKRLIVIPAEEELLKKTVGKYTFSIFEKGANCFIENIRADGTGAFFDVRASTQYAKDVRINIPGRHILSAVAIASSVIDILGENLSILKKALPQIEEKDIVRARLKRYGVYDVYDDTYSSSPEATIANFELLAVKYKKMSCVLGDMLELGAASESLHEKLGNAVVRYGFQRLFTFGKSASYIAKGAISAGMRPERIFINEDITAPQITAEQIKKNCMSDEILLFKASHATHAERIFDFL